MYIHLHELFSGMTISFLSLEWLSLCGPLGSTTNHLIKGVAFVGPLSCRKPSQLGVSKICMLIVGVSASSSCFYPLFFEFLFNYSIALTIKVGYNAKFSLHGMVES